MSEEEQASDDPPAVAAEKAVAADRAGDGPAPVDVDAIAVYLQWGLLALFVVFALVAAVGLYSNVGRIIRVWVAQDYRPVFHAAFNLLVLLVAALGVRMVLRRLRR